MSPLCSYLVRDGIQWVDDMVWSQRATLHINQDLNVRDTAEWKLFQMPWNCTGLHRSPLEIYRSTIVRLVSSVQLLSHVQLFVTPWTSTYQASLSITNSWNLLRLMSIESVMPSNHLIFCCPLLLPPSIFSCIGVFSKESALCLRWPKYWSFSFNISPSNEHPWSPLGWTGWVSLQSKGLSRVFSITTVQNHQFFSFLLAQLSHPYMTTGITIAWANGPLLSK